MHILMLLDREFPPDIRVENEALSLIKEGHVIHLLSYNHSGKANHEVYKGINIHRIKIHEQFAKKSLGLIHLIPIYKIFWRKAALRMIHNQLIDAVHIHDLPLCSISRELQKKGVKVVADMHENYPFLVSGQDYMNTFGGKIIFQKQIWFDKEKEWLETADEIICVASEMRIRLCALLGTSKPISVVPNTYNLNSFKDEQTDSSKLLVNFKDKFIVTYIGGFDAVRGINYLLDAIAGIKDKIPNLHLLLVGDGPTRKSLMQQTINLKIDDIVTFEGWQPSKFVKAYIEISNICVIPHVRSQQTDNSSPNKLFQYMFSSKPIISSNCTSIEKIILNEQCGLIYNDRNAIELGECILFLFRNPIESQKMGTNGHLSVVEKYNWDVTVRPLIELYEKL
jgi:glycosyltransferase involved in cell wall biosynthesis